MGIRNQNTYLLPVTAELKVLASLEDELVLDLAGGAFETENDLLGLFISCSSGPTNRTAGIGIVDPPKTGA